MFRKKLGNEGEEIAAQYYKSLGWQVIAQNFWTRYGELDLILKKNKQILLVEVKTRSNYNFGWAEESINEQKILRMQESFYIFSEEFSFGDTYSIEICLIYKRENKFSIKRLTI
ncbi:YraN family protein [Candidatus Parcubacteria bacterium]|jgi:putative endonuclease|nr:YraN family protein [Candidatus Parcubacteria bacterium]